jgi:hypothetical protein
MKGNEPAGVIEISPLFAATEEQLQQQTLPIKRVGQEALYLG